ncbi:MAG: oxygen-independent coproporphyrinogen III oxidase [Planctomycetota bacterium]|jgi:oxygen-independent coproporphyrinogen-3 oxidase
MQVTAELLRRYDRPGPRYTSYPPATEFHEGVDEAVYADHLEQASTEKRPLSLYVHLPFCEHRCLFCGCNVVITQKRDVMRRYLDILHGEIRDGASRLKGRRKVSQYHWGGGTPTYLTTDEMRELQAVVLSEFELEPDAEVAIEVDPRITTREDLFTLREIGFNRLSMGVQDFTPEVQEAVDRIQPFDLTKQHLEDAREAGFDSINIDLIYGLPHQTPEAFQRTLDQVNQLRPERIAVYSFAYLPWLKGQQRRLEESDLPAPEIKLQLFASALEAFRGSGYLAIGMDHFALPGDEMGLAVSNGTLWRNFMGYTVKHAPDMVGFGMSSIGDVHGAFFQNFKKLIDYERAVEAGKLPIERGYVLTADDHLRRHLITELMCTFKVDIPALEQRFGIDFGETFAGSLKELQPMVEDGFVRIGDSRIELLADGRLFVRNACMAFDPYLKRKEGDTRPRFSRTV